MLILHPWVTNQRGGERVFYEMARAFPDADLGLLFYDEAKVPTDIRSRIKRTSFLQHRAFRKLPYRSLLPLLPKAVDSLDVSSYDVVLSSSSGWTHGVRLPSDGVHYCYMHTPPRYLWFETQAPSRVQLIAKAALKLLGDSLRRWDLQAGRSVNEFAANSRHIAHRIRQTYSRDASVIYPPVDVEAITFNPAERDDYCLTVAEHVPYKRVDLAITAAKRAGKRLVVVGDGPQRSKLQALAEGGAVEFTGFVTRGQLVELLSRARVFVYPAQEDFGIVTVEALAAGTPVVGLESGGTGEIVGDGMGELVPEQETEPFADALDRAWDCDYDRDLLRERAMSFNPARFREQLYGWVGSPVTVEEAVVDSVLSLPQMQHSL